MILAYDSLPNVSPDIPVADYERKQNPYTGHVIWTAKND